MNFRHSKVEQREIIYYKPLFILVYHYHFHHGLGRHGGLMVNTVAFPPSKDI